MTPINFEYHFSCETHPLTQQLKIYQDKTMQRIYPLVQNKTEHVSLVRVPLPRHLLSILTKFQKDQINITTKILTKPISSNDKTATDIKADLEEETKDESVELITNEANENESTSDNIKTDLEEEENNSVELSTNENKSTVVNAVCVDEDLDKQEEIEGSDDGNQNDKNTNLPDFQALEKEKALYSFDEDKETMNCNFVDNEEKNEEILEVSGENPEDDNINSVPIIKSTGDAEIKEECSEDNLKDAKESQENDKENCINMKDKTDTDTETAGMNADETDVDDAPKQKETSEIDTNDKIIEITSEKDKDSLIIESGSSKVSFKTESKVVPETKSDNKDEVTADAKIELENKELVEDKISDKAESSADSSIERNLTDTTKSIKYDLETAIVKGQHLKDKLERENAILMSHARVSSIDIEKYNEENMDDLFDSDDENEDDDSAFGSSFYSSISGSWRTNSQISDNSRKKTLSTQISKISSDAQSDVGISLESKETDTEEVAKTCSKSETDSSGNCTKDENENKRNSLTKNVSFQNLESAIKQLRNEAYHRHLKQITEDILTSIEKIQVLFVIGFEQLDTAEGRDQCNVLVEKHFFRPIWKYLLLLFR